MVVLTKKGLLVAIPFFIFTIQLKSSLVHKYAFVKVNQGEVIPRLFLHLFRHERAFS